MGFDGNANPEALILTLADGHDFAVVDGRFIVDPWLTEIEDGRSTSPTDKVLNLGGEVVFDLEKDYELTRLLYGEMKNWQEVFP